MMPMIMRGGIQQRVIEIFMSFFNVVRVESWRDGDRIFGIKQVRSKINQLLPN